MSSTCRCTWQYPFQAWDTTGMSQWLQFRLALKGYPELWSDNRNTSKITRNVTNNIKHNMLEKGPRKSSQI